MKPPMKCACGKAITTPRRIISYCNRKGVPCFWVCSCGFSPCTNIDYLKTLDPKAAN